jgi:hypothetical protein
MNLRRGIFHSVSRASRLSEFVYLQSSFPTKDISCDTVVCYLITGACDDMDGEPRLFRIALGVYASVPSLRMVHEFQEILSL